MTYLCDAAGGAGMSAGGGRTNGTTADFWAQLCLLLLLTAPASGHLVDRIFWFGDKLLEDFNYIFTSAM